MGLKAAIGSLLVAESLTLAAGAGSSASSAVRACQAATCGFLPVRACPSRVTSSPKPLSAVSKYRRHCRPWEGWSASSESRRCPRCTATMRFGAAFGVPVSVTAKAMRKAVAADPKWFSMLPAPLRPFLAGVRALWNQLPGPVIDIVNPRDLLLWLVFQLTYQRALRVLYSGQVQLFRLFKMYKKDATPQPYDQSLLGFLEPRLHTLSRVFAMVYITNGFISVLVNCGWRIRPDLTKVVSSVAYYLYAGYFLDEAKKHWLPIWLPELKQDKRKGFIYNRTSSVLTWAIVILAVMELISTFLRIPITSTLAFGGVGGLAFGLASKDVMSNFFGGLMLLLSEPFTPGDMVLFNKDGKAYEGRVERVGWYQTRLRGRDTRPTYVPNNVFVESMVTNMDRITHRKFEVSFQLRYEDVTKVQSVVAGIKAALKEMPKVDLLSPFRVHLVNFTPTGLQFNIVCYFAIRGLDEFLYLQQVALLEIARVLTENSAPLAYPVYTVDLQSSKAAAASLINGLTDVHINGGLSPQRSPMMITNGEMRVAEQPDSPHNGSPTPRVPQQDLNHAGAGTGAAVVGPVRPPTSAHPLRPSGLQVPASAAAAAAASSLFGIPSGGVEFDGPPIVSGNMQALGFSAMPAPAAMNSVYTTVPMQAGASVEFDSQAGGWPLGDSW